MTRQQWAQLAGVVLLVAALVIVSVSVGVPGVSRLRDPRGADTRTGPLVWLN